MRVVTRGDSSSDVPEPEKVDDLEPARLAPSIQGCAEAENKNIHVSPAVLTEARQNGGHCTGQKEQRPAADDVRNVPCLIYGRGPHTWTLSPTKRLYLDPSRNIAEEL